MPRWVRNHADISLELTMDVAPARLLSNGDGEVGMSCQDTRTVFIKAVEEVLSTRN